MNFQIAVGEFDSAFKAKASIPIPAYMLKRNIIFLALILAAAFLPSLINNGTWFQNPDGSKRPASEAIGALNVKNPFQFASHARPSFDLSPGTIGKPSPNTFNGITSTVPVAPNGVGILGNPAQPQAIVNPNMIPVTSPILVPSAHGGLTAVGSPIVGVNSSSLDASTLLAPGQQTIVLPGDANGPNLSAVPMEFLPITDLGEIFRFNVSPDWVKQRWDRISTNPGEYGLSGLRTPLVTGVNASDLQGSLTYFFDSGKNPQKITFRGWTGDSQPLVRLLTEKYGFTPQPTNWAGLYMSQNRRSPNGVLIMKHPHVISKDNPRQQVAIMMELNNPQGRFSLSEEMKSVLSVARANR